MREFVQVPAGFRQMLEELADLAVLLLDELDGDVDLEPSLAGSYNGHHAYDAEVDTADGEPSLGSFDRMLDQSQWSRTADGTNGGDDLELDVSDREPSLGSLGHLDQTRWSAGDTRDREPNNDEIDYYSEERFIGNGCRLIPADALAVADARKRLGAIMDRVGGRR